MAKDKACAGAAKRVFRRPVIYNNNLKYKSNLTLKEALAYTEDSILLQEIMLITSTWRKESHMKAMVYHAANDIRLEE